MPSSKSRALNIHKKYKFLRPLYVFYNIYIRNFKFLYNGSQFGEEEILEKLFKKNFKGTYLDIGCFHPTKFNNTNKLYKAGWTGINIDLNPFTIDLFKTPIDFKIAISRVLFLTKIVKPEIILKVATIIIKDRIINITFLSTLRAENKELFISDQL